MLYAFYSELHNGVYKCILTSAHTTFIHVFGLYKTLLHLSLYVSKSSLHLVIHKQTAPPPPLMSHDSAHAFPVEGGFFWPSRFVVWCESQGSVCTRDNWHCLAAKYMSSISTDPAETKVNDELKLLCRSTQGHDSSSRWVNAKWQQTNIC